MADQENDNERRGDAAQKQRPAEEAPPVPTAGGGPGIVTGPGPGGPPPGGGLGAGLGKAGPGAASTGGESTGSAGRDDR